MKKKILLLTLMLTLGMANLIGQYTVRYSGILTNHPTTPVKMFVRVNGILVDSTLTNVAGASYNDSLNSTVVPTTLSISFIHCTGLVVSDSSTLSGPVGTTNFTHVFIPLSYCNPPCAASYTKHQAVHPITRLPIPNQVVIVNTSTGTFLSTTYTWNWGDGNSSIGVSPTHTYATHGIYLVCLTINHSGCTSTFCDTLTVDSLGIVRSSFTVTVGTATASIEEKETITGISFYPNPTKDNLTIDFNSVNSTNLNIQIMDIKGSIVMDFNNRVNAGNNILRISLSDLERGMYFIRLNDGKTISTKKIQLIK